MTGFELPAPRKYILRLGYNIRNLDAQMQVLTEKVFRLGPPSGLFDDTVVRNLFPEASSGARKQLIYRALAQGDIARLKPGLYCLAPEWRKSPPHPFVVASALHSPSHVSLESALAYHGLIPEAVYEVSSVSVLRSRTFRTPLGTFVFYRVPTNHPRAGVAAEELAPDAWAFVASPLRAIADIVYLRRGVRWKDDGVRFLTESMRIEVDDLREMSFDEYDAIEASFRNRRTKRYLEGLRKELLG
jgi:hypothetical protein